MNEGTPGGSTPEELKQREEQKQMELYEQWVADHPDPERRYIDEEHSPEIAELEQRYTSFESGHSLLELHAITEEEDARTNPVRQSAKEALDPILAILNTLERETNISPEKFKELKEKYRRLSKAVGIIDKDGKVDHAR